MRRILLDTDLAMGAPGANVDDGFALALAIADPDLSVELVTTVAGNTDVDTATRLTVQLLGYLGSAHIPVVCGAAGPLDPRLGLRTPGGSPAASAALGPTSGPSGQAAAALVERVMARPGALTIVAVGPLTNVARALLAEPQVADAVQEIVIMGGVFREQTNIATQPGEFNFWADPDAASAVLSSGAHLRFVGLDVTRRVRLTRADAARLAASGGNFAKFASACADAWISHRERIRPGDPTERGSCALHDPLAVAVVNHPDLVTWQSAHVAVETSSPVTRGVAIADLLMLEHPPEPNCRIATAVDADAFRSLFFEQMSALP